MTTRILHVLFPLVLFFSSCAHQQGLKNKSQTEKKADLYYSQGTQKLVDEQYSQALKYLLNAAEIRPEDSQTHNNLGMAYYFKKRPSKAINHLKRSIELDPKNSDARVNLGGIYFHQRKLNKALEQYKKVLDDLTYERQYRTHYNLALIYDRKGSQPKSLNHLKKSLAKNENYCPSIYRMGRYRFEQQDYEKAYKLFTKSSRGPCSKNKSPAPLYYRAYSQYKQNNLQNALDEFETVIQMQPDSSYSTKAKRQIRKIKTKIALSSRLKKDGAKSRPNLNEARESEKNQTQLSENEIQRLKKMKKSMESSDKNENRAEEIESPSF